LNHKREVVGPIFVAIDVVHAGPGDLVNWVASREAAMALPDAFVPVDRRRLWGWSTAWMWSESLRFARVLGSVTQTIHHPPALTTGRD